MTTYRLTITDDQGTVIDSTDVTAQDWDQALRYPDNARALLQELTVPPIEPQTAHAFISVTFAVGTPGEHTEPWYAADDHSPFPTPDAAWAWLHTDMPGCVPAGLTGFTTYNDDDGDIWTVTRTRED